MHSKQSYCIFELIKFFIKLIISRKNRIKEFFGYAFLILFLGYYGSITLFYHSHLVLGDTIVHSHPFKSDNNGKPLHSHSGKEYITIQFLSCIILSSVLFYLTLLVFAPQISKSVLETRHGFSGNSYLHLYSLRAPPLNCIN